jgi:quercetin dioxygenase-like cupin family protein
MGYFIDPETCESITPMPGITTRILSGLSDEKTMMVLTSVDPGVTVPAHSHSHEQVGIVYSGRARMRIGTEERVVAERDIYKVPSDLVHEAIAEGDKPFVVFEVFYPVREDFIDALRNSR